MFWLDCIPFGVVIPGICSRGIPAKHGASGHSRLLLLADAQLSIEKIGCFARQRRGALIVCYKIAALSALNGDDLAFVTVSLTDADGNLIPDANDQLRFEVKGAGSFKAVCNGDATSLEPFTQPTMRLFSGQLVVIVQAARQQGTATLIVTDEKTGFQKETRIPVVNSFR